MCRLVLRACGGNEFRVHHHHSSAARATNTSPESATSYRKADDLARRPFSERVKTLAARDNLRTKVRHPAECCSNSRASERTADYSSATPSPALSARV